MDELRCHLLRLIVAPTLTSLRSYRDGYPGEQDDPNESDNLKFYTGKIASRPDGDFIDGLHDTWYGKYGKLEAHHGYIQWIFPIREHGMNSQSQKLQPHEVRFELDRVAPPSVCMSARARMAHKISTHIEHSR